MATIAATFEPDSELAEYARTRSPELRSELVQRYYWIVEHVARRYRHRGESEEDIAQVAALGLIAALDRFDPSMGRSFPSFAIPTATGEVRRYFRDRTWRVRVPRSVKDLSVQVGRASADLSADLGREPRTVEIAARLGVPVGLVDEARAASAANRMIPTEARNGSESEHGSGVDPPSVHRGGPDDLEDLIALGQKLEQLPAPQRRLIHLYFFQELSQEQAAAELGISQPHVSRLLRAALSRLRHELTPTRP